MQLSIVSYLDETATKEVRELQVAVSKVTGSKASLSSWSPHITIGDGVDVGSEEDFETLKQEIAILAQSNAPFEIGSYEFSARDSRNVGVGEVSTQYVLELRVVVNENLNDFVSRVYELTKKYNKWYKMPRPYHPHITIAFRDLEKEGFERGIAYLEGKSISIKSGVRHVALVEKFPETDVEKIRFALSA